MGNTGPSSILYGTSHQIISNEDSKSLMEVICSSPGCGIKGVAYVDPKSNKPHYCIEHNPMIVKIK